MFLAALDFIDFAKTASQLGVAGLLVIVLIGGFRRWWVWGWAYSALERERNEWRQLALSGTALADKLTTVQEKRLFNNGDS